MKTVQPLLESTVFTGVSVSWRHQQGIETHPCVVNAWPGTAVRWNACVQRLALDTGLPVTSPVQLICRLYIF